ncbi:MAG: FAD-dependent oxidoreductase, partial [Firmicutes bacterium]|nr:FAD-dependent oxidoreductase [Bacillota bacterium]
MRKTKIICTIGPASESEEMLRRMCKAGMNVARLNFSHGSHEEHKAKIESIKKVRKELGLPIAIMLDTKGPEYRIGTFENHKVELKEGDTFTFACEECEGDEYHVSVSYKNMYQDLKPGDEILVNNGLVVCRVEHIEGVNVVCTVVSGGTLSDKKSMNFPGKVLADEFLSEQDKADLLFGIENGVEGLRIMESEELHAKEPNLNPEAVAALWAPTGGIVDPYGACLAFAETAARNGVE